MYPYFYTLYLKSACCKIIIDNILIVKYEDIWVNYIVYARKPRTLEELQQEIEIACGNIFIEIIQNVCRSVYGRFEKYIVTRGRHFEHS